MKLIYCKNCDSIIRLVMKHRECECGKCGGRYIDKLNAIYYGKYAFPFGIDNYTFGIRLREDIQENIIYNTISGIEKPKNCDIGGEFKAFALLRNINGCADTFKKVLKKYYKDYENKRV